MEIILDGNEILDKDSLFKTLKKQINSEDFIGNNLDALWDALLYCNNPIKVTIINKEKLNNTLGEYYAKLCAVFNDLTANNIDVEITE